MTPFINPEFAEEHPDLIGCLVYLVWASFIALLAAVVFHS